MNISRVQQFFSICQLVCNQPLQNVVCSQFRQGMVETACLCSTQCHLEQLKGWDLDSSEGIFPHKSVPGLGNTKQLKAGTNEGPLASLSILTQPLHKVYPAWWLHGSWTFYLSVSSGFTKLVSQGKESNRSHISFQNLISEVTQYHYIILKEAHTKPLPTPTHCYQFKGRGYRLHRLTGADQDFSNSAKYSLLFICSRVTFFSWSK